MTRQGYFGEYKAKKELIETYGKEAVLKIAIAQIGADFMIIKNGRLLMIVEVKETTAKYYYPHPKEKKQFDRIKHFAMLNNCKAELWVYYRRGFGVLTEKIVTTIYQ